MLNSDGLEQQLGTYLLDSKPEGPERNGHSRDEHPRHDAPRVRSEPALNGRVHDLDRKQLRDGLFVLFDFSPGSQSGPLSALPRASAKRALELGTQHLHNRPSHDVSIGLVFVGMQFSVARIDRSGAAFSPMRQLKEKDGLEVLVRVVRSLKQGAQVDPKNPPKLVHKYEIWELPKDE